ncbi:uncharacterized protein B0H18DRAFT_1106848, partial [Fomitopsis serialis]|uniref:uncharacterized protein n=1 Tax=Fomitopsis serialis TaxID=139415 RepID=UPI0020081DB6
MFRSRPLRGPGSPPARRGRAVVANPRRVHPYYNAAQPGLQTEGDSPRGGAPQPTAPP